jgi:NAD(P)-dependent dehydrogenase (short-subunit alcohol dehydrogenase family)
LRRRQGLTQDDLSRRTGISRATICKMERGSLDLHPEIVGKLLAYFGKEAAEAFPEGKEPVDHFIPVKDYAINRWMRSWAVNVHAPFILSKLVLEEMVPRESGSIVNISSGAAIGPGRGPYPNALQAGGGTCYGAEKAALERFTQGLAAEVYRYGISVTCVSPSQVVPTPGTVFHRLVRGLDDPRGEPPELMAKAALLLATEPLDKVTGRVTYSQLLLKEYGWLDEAKGIGVDPERPLGSGYSRM